MAEEIQQLRSIGRESKADKLQGKLDRLEGLTLRDSIGN
jgi:hypothetical protein